MIINIMSYITGLLVQILGAPDPSVLFAEAITLSPPFSTQRQLGAGYFSLTGSGFSDTQYAHSARAGAYESSAKRALCLPVVLHLNVVLLQK
jgi:hypothetical protein